MQEKENHFIKNIEIKNFKCFEDFKAEGFGRVNLIGGKNNVGKTAFMEAVYIDTSSKNISNLLYAISTIQKNRDKVNLLIKNEINIIDILSINKSFDIIGTNDIKYRFNDKFINQTLEIILNDEKEEINLNSNISFISNENITFIDNFGFNNEELKNIYAVVLRKEKENILNNYLNEFDEVIEKFKIPLEYPEIKLVNDNKYKNLNQFGDGLKQYISIICSLYACEYGYLFIDEIENGIHYSKLDEMWEIILSISKKQNVQVFATTHSKECIESYARVAKKRKENENDEDFTFIELGRNNDNKIESIIYPYEWLIDEVEQNHEVRGW